MAGLILLAGCGKDLPANEMMQPLTSALPSEGGVLRVPLQGGEPVLLYGDSLTPSSWNFAGSLPPLSRPLGVDRDDHTAWFLSAKGSLIGIDLDARNAQTRLTSTRQITASSDGFVFGLDSSRRAFRMASRGITTYRAPVVGGTVQLFRAPGGQVSIFSGSEHLVQVLGSDGEIRRFDVPDGTASASWFGDLIAISNDSGVTFVEQTPGRDSVFFVSLRGTPVTAAFSPSGHRIYVALQKGEVAVLDRLERDVLSTIALGGIATRLRTDRSGRWLLASPAQGDSLWLVDLVQQSVVARFRTPWREDLPEVIDGQSLLVRQGNDLVSYALTGPAPVERKRLIGAGDDLYLPVYWLPNAPRRPATVLAAAPGKTDSTDQAPPTAPVTAKAEQTAAAEEPPAKAGTEAWYLQVSSSQNQDFSKAFADQLVEAGYPARVLSPSSPDQGYRVILGPYPTHDAADAVGKKLGRAYFVMTLDPPSP